MPAGRPPSKVEINLNDIDNSIEILKQLATKGDNKSKIIEFTAKLNETFNSIHTNEKGSNTDKIDINHIILIHTVVKLFSVYPLFVTHIEHFGCISSHFTRQFNTSSSYMNSSKVSQ